MSTPEEVIEVIRKAQKKGEKGQAIKMVQHAVEIDRKVAKELLDHNLDGLKPEHIRNIKPMPESRGCGGKVAVALLIGLGLFKLFMFF